jgi:hypothetical protein
MLLICLPLLIKSANDWLPLPLLQPAIMIQATINDANKHHDIPFFMLAPPNSSFKETPSAP